MMEPLKTLCFRNALDRKDRAQAASTCLDCGPICLEPCLVLSVRVLGLRPHTSCAWKHAHVTDVPEVLWESAITALALPEPID